MGKGNLRGVRSLEFLGGDGLCGSRGLCESWESARVSTAKKSLKKGSHAKTRGREDFFVQRFLIETLAQNGLVSPVRQGTTTPH